LKEIAMNMKKSLKAVALSVAVTALFLAEVSPEAPLGVTFPREAAAIVGAPMTPMSVAGVARRTTVRVAETEMVAASAATATAAQQQQAVAKQQQATAQQQAATAQQQAAVAQQQAQAAGSPALGTVVPALPAGCAAAPKGGIEYYKCGNVYYRSAFQGNNLVYVVAQP
jgi:hypothetical protein